MRCTFDPPTAPSRFMPVSVTCQELASIRGISGLLRALALVLAAGSFPQVASDFAAPISFEPGGWDGNDGPWSTFSLRVGSQPSRVRLLPSFYYRYVSVVPREGCPDVLSITNCSEKRGGLFNTKDSTRWKSANLNTAALAPKNVTSLDGKPNGTDVVLIGSETLTQRLENQAISLRTGMTPFTGFIGLSGDEESAVMPSFLDNVVGSSSLDVKSWSYTAGSVNRNEPGSLIIGGYDESRFAKNTVTPWVTMDGNSTRRFTLNLSGLSIGPRYLDRWTTYPFTRAAVLDSSTPFLWFPTEVCDYFEKLLGLQWDEASQLYLVSDLLHQNLTASQPYVTFNLSDPRTPTDGYPFMVSYEALDLNASYPLVNASAPTRYFPLKRMADTDQGPCLLGRAFLQDAYLMVNYRDERFRLASARYDKSIGPRIKTITSIAQSGDPTSPSPPPASTSSSSRPIIVILIAVVSTVVSLVLGIAYFGVWAYKNGRPPFKHIPMAQKFGDREDNFSPGGTRKHDTPDQLSSREILEAAGQSLHESSSKEILEADSATIEELPASIAEAPELMGDLAQVHEMDGSRSVCAGLKESGPRKETTIR